MVLPGRIELTTSPLPRTTIPFVINYLVIRQTANPLKENKDLRLALKGLTWSPRASP